MAVGFKVADAYVEIHTEDDTRKGRQKVDRDTSKWANGLGHKLGRIISVGMLAGIGKALLKALAQTAKLAAFGLVAGVVASAIGGLASAVANLIPIIAELVNVAIAASGSLLLIPGAIAGIIAVVATAKLGLKGFGEALKAVGEGDAAALNEALKKLAPNARAFVKEIARLKPAFDRLRLKIQNTLFIGLATRMRELGRVLLPILNEQLFKMAQVLNGVVRDALDFLLTRQTRIDLARILNSSAVAANNLRKGLTPILSILRDIVTVSSGVLASLTTGFGRTLEEWAANIAQMRADGGLEALIRDGLAAVKELAGLLVDVVGIIRGLVRAAGGAGGLFGFFDRLNQLINSLEGQRALREIFGDLDRIGRALIPVLLAILKALVPVIDGIAAIAIAFSPGLTVLAVALGNALKLLADPIASLAPLLFAIARGLAPVAVILGQLVKAATPGLTAFLEALVDGLIALVPVAPIVGKALGDLFEALAPLLRLLGPALALLLGQLALALSAMARVLGPLIKLFAEGLGQALQRLLPLLIDAGTRILPMAAQAGEALARAFAPLIPVLLQVVELFIAQLVPHIPQVVAMFGQLVQAVTTAAAIFGQALLQALLAIMPILPDLIDAGLDLTRAFLDMLVALTPLIPPLARLLAELIKLSVQSGLLKLLITGLIGILTVITSVLQIVASVVRRVNDALSAARGGVSSFGKAVSAAINTAIGLFQRLGATIRTAVGNLGNLLFDAGRRVIQGLINGVRNALPSLSDVISSAANLVRNFWPFSPAKTGPLSGRGDLRFAGQNIVDRLTQGISERINSARSSAAGLAGVFAGPMGAGLAGAPGVASLGARGGGGSGPSTFGPYRIEVDGKVIAQIAIDAVTGQPQQIAATVDEGRRQRGFIQPSRARR